MPLPEIEAGAHAEKGKELLRKGKHRRARKEFLKALELDPKHFDALMGLAEYCMAHGMHSDEFDVLPTGNAYRDAIPLFNDALEVRPNDINALLLKAFAHGKLGQFDEAMECFDRVLELEPNNTDALHDKALTHLRKGVRSHGEKEKEHYKEALRLFEKAHKLDPQDVYPAYHKGYTLMLMDRDEEAIEWLDKAIELDPDNKARLYPKDIRGSIIRHIKFRDFKKRLKEKVGAFFSSFKRSKDEDYIRPMM